MTDPLRILGRTGPGTYATAPILYLGGRIGNVPIDQYIKPALIFMIFGNIPIIIMTTYMPGLSMWLPRLLMGVK